MLEIFKRRNCTVLPTAPGASNQVPVKRHHQAISSAARATPVGADLPIKSRPCCLSHAVQVFNFLPSKGQTASSIEIGPKVSELMTLHLRHSSPGVICRASCPPVFKRLSCDHSAFKQSHRTLKICSVFEVCSKLEKFHHESSPHFWG